jgi:hypothetical protein
LREREFEREGTNEPEIDVSEKDEQVVGRESATHKVFTKSNNLF